MRSDCDDYKQSGARSRRSVGAAKSKQPPPAHIDESKGKGFPVAHSDSCSCTPSSSIRAPQSRSRASSFLAPFRLARESFTIADNHEHNEGIGSQPLALKVLFLLTNAPYFLAALKMFVSTQRPLPIVSGLRCFCEVASFNVFFVCLLAFISSTFHFKQCFCCRSKAELDSCVWWNDIDIKCAGEYLLRANESRAIEWRRTAQACACFEVFFFSNSISRASPLSSPSLAGTYGLYLLACFFKRSLLHIIPAAVLLVVGGICKLQGWYTLYFFFHGLWHVGGSLYFYHAICHDGDRLLM